MTLLESCLSIVVILVAMAISVPALVQTRDDQVLNTVARDVATKLHSARIQAISGNCDCRLRVASETSYVVECQKPKGPWQQSESVDLPRGFRISANARPEFHRLGNVAPAATLTVHSAGGRKKSVIVNTGGRVRLE